MSAYGHLATFERKTTFDDFGQTGGDWVLLWRAFVALNPVPILAQRFEFVESKQVTWQRKHIVKTHWRDGLKTGDRLKVRRNEVVDKLDSEADANYRIFEIEAVINGGELNRELELLVQERT